MKHVFYILISVIGIVVSVSGWIFSWIAAAFYLGNYNILIAIFLFVFGLVCVFLIDRLWDYLIDFEV